MVKRDHSQHNTPRSHDTRHAGFAGCCRVSSHRVPRERTLPPPYSARTTAAGLAARLLDASGVPALRAEIADRCIRRRDLLKARHALLTTRQVALASSDGPLLREVERVLERAHDFAELRVLNALRRSGLELGEARVATARRLLGEAGTDVEARLGLDVGAGADDVRRALVDRLAMWQDQSEHPLAGPDTAAAARVLVRTCEGLLAVTAIAETA